MADSSHETHAPDSSSLQRKTPRKTSGNANGKKSGKSTWIMLTIAVVVVVGLGVFFFMRANGEADEKKASHAPPPVSVAVAPVTRGDMGVRIDALGTVTPLQTVTVTSRVQGQVMKVAYIEGQTVRPGDLLVDIDPRPYQAALLQARGQLERDEATFEAK